MQRACHVRYVICPVFIDEIGKEKEDSKEQHFADRDKTGSWTMREGVVLVRELALFVVYLDVLLYRGCGSPPILA
jgi:hypothetical protein